MTTFPLNGAPATYMLDTHMSKLKIIKKKHCRVRFPVFLHPSLYRALKLEYPGDIGGLSIDDTIESERDTGSIGKVICVLTPAKFNAEDSNRFHNVSLVNYCECPEPEAARCEVPSQSEIWETQKQVGLEKSPEWIVFLTKCS